MSRSSDDDLALLGRVGGAYGVKGWLKIISHTEPRSGILAYKPWYLKRPGQSWARLQGFTGKPHGKGIVAHFDGCDDRDAALAYQGSEIAIRKEQLQELEAGDYYWHQLEGLQVIADGAQDPILLGRVSYMLATGGNDVMVVGPCEGSIDDQERLLPYLPEQVIKQVDLAAGKVLVDWDPEF